MRILVLLCLLLGFCSAFVQDRPCWKAKSHQKSTKRSPETFSPPQEDRHRPLFLASSSDDDDDNKFGFLQRIESVKCLVIGAIAGSFALVPFSLLHNLLFLPPNFQTNPIAQWEFDNDMAGFMTGLFAIVYRYCIREDDNEQLQQGVVGAFVVTRTLSRILVPTYCSAIVLNCGPPFGYFDWSMISQLAINGAESAAMFAATAAAINYAIEKGWLTKFPG